MNDQEPDVVTNRTNVVVPGDLLRLGDGPHRVHTAHWDGADPAATPVVCVHGLGGSHLNWSLMGPRLASHGPVWAPDLAGFGLTPPREVGGSATGARLEDNLDLVVGFVRTVSPEHPVLLAGNSMGGLLAVMAGARHPELVAGLVIVNPALPVPLSARIDPQVLAQFAGFVLPGVGERVLRRRAARVTPEQQVAATMRMVSVDPASLDADLVAAHVDLARQRRVLPHANPAFLEASRSLVRRMTLGRVSAWNDVRAVQAPTLVMVGGKDRLVRSGTLDKTESLRPDWEVVRYPELGHVPQLEAPQRVSHDIGRWLAWTSQGHAA